MANKAAWRRVWPPSAAFVVFVALWQAACDFGRVDPWILPAPSAIALRMKEDAGLLAGHLGATLQLALSGVAIGLAAGVAVAILLHLMPFVRSALSPFVIASQNVPLIALGPLLMIWFGFGLTPKLILLTLVCFFPVAWSMLAGLGRAEPHLREYLAMIGASRRDMLLRLELPASLPYLFAGLKITVTYSVTSAIVAEWLGASRGIGYYLVLKFKGYDTSAVFGAVLCIVALCLALYGLASLLEQGVVRRRLRTRPVKAGWRK
ncbi:ABC transporter permease subunit [Cohnella sp. CFH 77786]|uniref:ABC transporter permease n=1 Tax=Cohnella sp. CFH 77786 TaxID=2662265 RepID=UPI001C60F251|nr:ABC transporter permease [Cohnella sp. CFH 77786]MBW5444634.1 ABC transporter permease subunit [Cohnella sp. CFH 77786]